MIKVIFVFLLLTASLNAQSACSIATLKGSYIASGNYMGYVNNQPMSCGVLSVIVFNGRGAVNITELETCEGLWYNNGNPSKFPGTYTMDSSCTGIILTNFANLAFSFDKAMKNGQIIGGNQATGLSGSGTILKQ